MPVDLVCATASFSRITRKLLAGMDGVDIVIDDKMVCTMSFRHHLPNAERIVSSFERGQVNYKA